MIEWPSDKLPSPRVDFSYKGESTVIANRMESGATRQRRRFSSRRKVVKLSWMFDYFQLGLFESWFEHKINFGATKFLIDLPSSEAQGLSPHNVVIQNGVYDVEALAGEAKWEVQVTVIADEFSVFTEGIFDVLIQSNDKGAAFILAADVLESEIQHFSNEHTWE